MNNKATIVFPNQLFKNHICITKNSHVVLIEDKRFFLDFNFHKKKILLHRASMQAYKNELELKDHIVHYISSKDSDQANILKVIKKIDPQEIYLTEVIDYELEKKLKIWSKKLKSKIFQLQTPAFLSSSSWIKEFFQAKKQFHMNEFYIAQRKRFNILIQNGKPIKSKWSFDKENRKKIPANFKIPDLPRLSENQYVREAISYVNNNFSLNPGNVSNFIYPVTHEDAQKWLNNFLDNRLAFFGDYQDAILENENFLFHSIISPLLNIGLITPEEAVKKAIKTSEKKEIPINSLEGFIRQIIGWREFIRGVYIVQGQKQRHSNFWKNKRKLNQSFYNGRTNITPIDIVIKRVQKYAYAHHIERLMILGNFMQLIEIDPNDVFRWFMEMFIDAYDWVMVPNVYGMSQYADGGLMSSKPYISSSNYIKKMSNFKHDYWCEIWDALFWSFICKHQKVFKKNPRMSLMVNQLKKKQKEEILAFLKITKKFFNQQKI